MWAYSHVSSDFENSSKEERLTAGLVANCQVDMSETQDLLILESGKSEFIANKMGHSSRSSSIQKSKTNVGTEVSGFSFLTI